MKKEKNIKKKKYKINKKRFFSVISFTIILITCISLFTYVNGRIFGKKQLTHEKTIKSERLVLKSTKDYNKIVVYTFTDNRVSGVKIYEQFRKDGEYVDAIEKYKQNGNITIIKSDDKDKSIEIEKSYFGTDANLTYDEVYNKYLVKISKAYKVVK